MNKLLAAALVGIFITGLVACESGPFEKWGKKTDDAARNVKDKAQKLSDDINDRGPAQKVGNRLDKKLD